MQDFKSLQRYITIYILVFKYRITKSKRMTLSSILPKITAPKKLTELITALMPLSQNSTVWSDKEAELSSHIEILNQSALVSVSDLKGKIIHANELFCTISKYNLDEILNKSHNIIRHPETCPSVFKEMWSTIGRGQVWQGEIKNKAKDGSDYWVIATVAPVMGKNRKPVKYISIRYDITKQKQAEEELRQAKKKIDNELLENIAYAKHIHSSFLTNNTHPDHPNDSFLLYKAQKIISGDFYKIERNGNKVFIAIGDSTGHGISASYISVLALNILSRVMKFCCGNPGKMLKMINTELNRITHFNKEKQLIESADMIVCSINKELMKLTYASARMRAFIIRDDEIILLDKDKSTVGEVSGTDFKINNRNIDIKKGDSFYILSDGMTDQIGGPYNKRIGFKNVLSFIKECQCYSMDAQKELLEGKILEWKGKNEQTDDITLFGMKI